jgi:hypothetical protein
MSAAIHLAAMLSRRGVIAVPTQDETVRTWLSGTGRGVLTVHEVFANGESVWAWQRDGRSGTHPVSDDAGAADVITTFLREDPP